MARITAAEALAKAETAYAEASRFYDRDGRARYSERTNHLEMVFEHDLGEAHVTTVPELIWRRAWMDHHSEGYQAVAENYAELAELVAIAETRAIEGN